MKRTALLSFSFCLVSWITTPNARAVELNFTLFVLGVPTGDASLAIAVTTPAYSVGLRFRTTGIADLLMSDHIDERSNGRFENDAPSPTHYTANARRRGEDRITDIIWRDGAPVLKTLIPPNSMEREDTPPSLLTHAMDPLDAIVFLIHQVAQSGRCEGTARAYDGRRLQLLQSRTGGDDDLSATSRSSFSGRALRCDFTDHTLAGFRFGSGRADDERDHRGTVWFARILPDAPMLPVRASIETRWFGEATLYMTSALP